jgi:protein-L-isoaspartate(D-aspartate) O-methyltransferase
MEHERRITPARVAMTWVLLPALGLGASCRAGTDPWVTGGNGHMGTGGAGSAAPAAARDRSPAEAAAAEEEPALTTARLRMVREQIESRGVRDPLVLEAMRKVPRHRFVPEGLLGLAYDDGPLPIGEGQTISQPYIVALMTELLHVRPEGKVLEIGTGSGYQAAVLAEMGLEVYTIEIVATLAESARRKLEAMGYRTIRFRVGDGYRGWAEAAPFDGIIVTAAPDHVPEPLVEQLEVGGRMVIPVGSFNQDLKVITRTPGGAREEESIPVRFVPMTGEAQGKPH